jgi:hypothetical protein
MGKIFVSCGQYTPAEKSLGKAIVTMTKDITGFDVFFAEEVQDLNGLDSNILSALRDCDGFITILHPRGAITRPDGPPHIRASVWIEQEIAIATYIHRVEKKNLPVIAFVHESVSLEGIRQLLHLNPKPFTHESEVLAALPKLLEAWKTLPTSGIRVELKVGTRTNQQGHWLRELTVNLVNDGNQRISKFNCQVCLLGGLLKHQSAMYYGELPSDDRYRRFRSDEASTGAISPHTTAQLFQFPYCTRCAVENIQDHPTISEAIVGASEVEAKVWIDGREYGAKKTIKELSQVA